MTMPDIETRTNENLVVLGLFLIFHVIVLFLPSLLFGICFPLMFIADMNLAHNLLQESERRFERPHMNRIITGCNLFTHYPNIRERLTDAFLETISPELMSVDDETTEDVEPTASSHSHTD